MEDIKYRPTAKDRKEENLSFPIESDYRKTLMALNQSGVLSILPQSEKLGVIGIDGKEYPIPTLQEARDVFDHNSKLVEEKRRQGFARLQLTPLAIPIPVLISRVEKSILRHKQSGNILQSKRDPNVADAPAHVDINEPVWIWDTVREAIKANDVVYFPKQFDGNHKGKPKDSVLSDPKICPIPGWSIGIVEDREFLATQGNGQTVNGRKQIENNTTPKDYIKILQGKGYGGESGWTYEDFLADFLIKLEQTGRVSHEWRESNATWLIGSYLPNSAYVPDGRWFRGNGQLAVYADDPDYRTEAWGVRSTVRLGL